MRHILVRAAAMTLIASSALAGEATVNWQSPEKYSDIRAGNETKDGFQSRVFKDLGMVFADLAKKLPDGYQLDVTVTDLDLAGDVNGMYATTMRDIRIIKALYWPRISFSYTLKDPKNALVVSGKEDLKDMGFMDKTGMPSGNTSFNYEETMLRDWFNKQQRDQVFPKK